MGSWSSCSQRCFYQLSGQPIDGSLRAYYPWAVLGSLWRYGCDISLRMQFFEWYLRFLAIGWQTRFSNISFLNVANRGRLRWAYDGLYIDEDGTLGGLPNSVIMAPDGINNASLMCNAVPDFDNAIRCPLSEGSWIRYSLRDWQERSQGQLQISNDRNSSTIVPWLQKQLTHPRGYMTVLRANQTYKFNFSVNPVRYLDCSKFSIIDCSKLFLISYGMILSTKVLCTMWLLEIF